MERHLKKFLETHLKKKKKKKKAIYIFD